MNDKTKLRKPAEDRMNGSVIVVGASDLLAVSAILNKASPALAISFADGMPRRAQIADDVVLIVLTRAPAEAVCASLETGLSVDEALERWHTATERLLMDCRGLRRRLALVDEGTLLRADPAVLAALGDRLSVSFDVAAAPAPGLASDPKDDLGTIIGEALIANSERARMLCDELLSMQVVAAFDAALRLDTLARAWSWVSAARTAARDAVEPSETEEVATLRAAFAALQDEAAAQAKALDRALGERERLRSTLEELLSELQGHLARLEKSDAERAELRRHSAEASTLRVDTVALRRQISAASDLARRREAVLGDQILNLSRALNDAQAYGKAAATEIASQTATLEVLRREADEMASRNDILLAEARAAQDELERVFASHSWRVTEPLRRFRHLIGPSAR